jgi:hypothetical protein
LINQLMDGWIDRWIDGSLDQWINGWTHRYIDRYIKLDISRHRQTRRHSVLFDSISLLQTLYFVDEILLFCVFLAQQKKKREK